MVISGLPSKSSQVANFLRKGIASGRLPPETRIATVRNLARQFSVSNKVVELALDTLENEKLITRKPRQGVFVTGRGTGRHSTIALFTETSGHIYENQTNRMVKGFQKKNFMTIVVDINEFMEDKEHQEKTFSDLISRNLDGIVIDGIGIFPFHLLIKNLDRLPALAFFNRFEFNRPFEALYVLSDSYRGVRDATSYLLGTGCRRIMFFTHDPTNFIDDFNYHAGDHAKTIKAYSDAVREVSAEQIIFFSDNTNDSELERILRSKERPDAILSYGDFRAKTVLDICSKIGLNVPADILVMGYHNTPWTAMLDIPLSSVSIQEELIAENIVSRMTEPHFRPEKIYVRPELVIRESTLRNDDMKGNAYGMKAN